MRRKLWLLFLILQCLCFDLKADTVICVHGFLDCCKNFKLAKGMLIYHGFEVCLWEYPSRKKYIQEHATDLAQRLQAIAQKHPGEPIHFVSHSIGGLVVRATINHPCCPLEAKIGKAVLFAPPNKGSALGRRFRNFFPINLAMGHRSGWELMNYSPEQISCFGNFPPTMDVLVVAGTQGLPFWFKEPNDCYLSVSETWLDTPFTFLEFPVRHGDLLKSPKILNCMLDFLLKPNEICPNPL